MHKVEVFDLSHRGEGVCRVEGKVCFVPGLLPGEEALIEITEEKARFSRGILIEVLKSSPARRKSPCAYQGDCGGCPIMHLDETEQILWKKNSTEKNMEKIAGVQIIFEDIFPAERTLGYRNKLTLFYKEGALAMRKANSHELVPIDDCLLAQKEMREILPFLQGQRELHSLVLRRGDQGMMVILQGEKFMENPELYENLEQAGVKSIYFCQQKQNLPALSGKITHVRGKRLLDYTVMDRNFSLSPRSFFQINQEQMEQLYELVLQYAELEKDNRVLDLYSGQGTLGAFVAGHCMEVIGIEFVEEAVELGEKHLPANMKLVQGKVEDHAKSLPKVDVVILDPPRAGLHPKVIEALMRIEPKRIVYVSCDPATQARDIKALLSAYKIERAGLVDLFPNTHHVESVALLSKLDVGQHINVEIKLDELDLTSTENKVTYA